MKPRNKNARCPTCDKPFVPDPQSMVMPFCSERCKLADLHRWMSEDIGIPHGSSEPEDQEEEAPSPPSSPREWRFD
ncbi:DNA gyrase inhibitor YacG [Pirellulaceae bacterium SH467]